MWLLRAPHDVTHLGQKDACYGAYSVSGFNL